MKMVLRNRFKDDGSIRDEPERIAKMDDVLKDMSLQKIRDRMEDLQKSTLQNINEQLSTLVGEVMKDMEKCGVSHEFNQLFQNNKNEFRQGKLRDKLFMPRNSLLTDLFEIKHISTIHNIFIVIISFLFLQGAIGDYFDTGSLNFGISTIQITFNNFSSVIFLWICMFISTLLVYNVFSIWAHVHIKLEDNSSAAFVWDRLWIFIYILYQVTFLSSVAYFAGQYKFMFGSGMVVFCEQTRFMMKCHAFVRSNAPRVLAYNKLTRNQSTQKDTQILLPGFSKYLYFLFAPTAVYRDCYPRTKEIRWKFLLWNIYETTMVLLLLSNLTERFIFNAFDNYGVTYFDTKTLLYKIVGLTCPALFIYFSGFYLFLHSWHNAWAEGLRFADRLFYKDWWNATNFSEFFRKWNIIVHDWLYFYVYKDLHENLVRNNILLPFISVFLISSIFHEYIIAMSIGFVYPVMFVFFAGVGVFAIFLTKKLEQVTKNAGNVFLWTGISLGNAMMISFYSMEFFARRNCTYTNDSIFEFAIPRSWFCNN